MSSEKDELETWIPKQRDSSDSTLGARATSGVESAHGVPLFGGRHTFLFANVAQDLDICRWPS